VLSRIRSKTLACDLVGVGEPRQGLRFALAVGHRDRRFQADWPGDQTAEVLDCLWKLEEVPVKAHDDGDVAGLGKQGLHNVQSEGKVDSLFPGAQPWAE
jgi:hypothetical protein